MPAMDPQLANLNLDPPSQPSPLRRGLLPALLVHAVFFLALALGVQWRDGAGDELASAPDTRTMGGPPASTPASTMGAPAATSPATTPAPGTDVAPAATQAIPPPPPMPAPVRPATPAARNSAQVPAPAPAPAQQARPGTVERGARAGNGVSFAVADTRPSFDCAKARSRPERLICSDAELARLDRDTGRLHARAKAAARDPAAFKRQNDREWKQREADCRDKACLLAWYANRRAQLQQTLAQAR